MPIIAPQTLTQGYTIEFYSDNLEGKVVHNSSIQVKRAVWGVLSGLEPEVYAEMEAVDLGLSVKWGNMNLGASKLNEYGDYYAWGETVPNKSAYTWDNYAWGSPSKGFTKYASSKDSPVLEPEDDAANKYLGGKWRMATIEEFRELYEECTWENTELDGIVCYKVSRNGKYIYLPAYPGYYKDGSLMEQGSGGYYWSSSVMSSNRSYAQNLWTSGSPSLQSGYRYFGEVIRPVYDDAWHSVTGVSIKSDYYVAVGSERTLEAIVMPSNASDRSMDWSSSDPAVAWVSENGVVHGVSNGMATITVTTKDGGKTASSSIHVVSMPEPVDLGLSVQWASFNLGASEPEDRGDYYAWGETEPYYTLNPLSWHPGKGNGYDWWSYQWMDVDELTKYFLADGKTMLDPEDDAAFTTLGGMWRMPTKAEWTELVTKCNWTWTTVNGKNVREVTGPNGKSIVLPAAGFMDETYLDDFGTDGYYWSSSLHYSYSPAAWLVYFSSSRVYEDYDDRFYGFSVRPVYGSHDKVSVESISLDKSNLALSVGESASLSATVFPENATNKTFVWSSSNAAVASVSSQGEVTGTGMGTAKISAQTVDGDKTATCFVVVTYSSTPIPEAIDLGLPSGLKWASFNVGAGKQEEYGDYFAWGETEPYYEPGYALSDAPVWKQGKEAGYDLASYKWCKGSSDSMTKYCTDPDSGHNGFTDGKTVLDPEDDAAHVKLGGKWRMPTDAEWDELRAKCSWKWTTVNGVKGRLVTGPSGKTIFLPAAGGYAGVDPYDTGSYGYCMSSSLDTDEPEFAWGIGFYSNRVGKVYAYRYEGLSIRAVSE